MKFIDIKGAKESSNTGFTGEGYANVDNEKGSYVTYGVTAAKAGKYALYIRFANGGGSARGYSLSVGDKTLIEDGSMESTDAWTTWKTQKVEVELEKGYSVLKFESLSGDGMANIDYIGWMSEDLYAGEKDTSDITSITRHLQGSSAAVNDRYFVNFGSNNSATGVYLMRGSGKVYRVNGRAR